MKVNLRSYIEDKNIFEDEFKASALEMIKRIDATNNETITKLYYVSPLLGKIVVVVSIEDMGILGVDSQILADTNISEYPLEKVPAQIIDYKELLIRVGSKTTAEEGMNISQSILNANTKAGMDGKIPLIKVIDYRNDEESQIVMPSIYGENIFMNISGINSTWFEGAIPRLTPDIDGRVTIEGSVLVPSFVPNSTNTQGTEYAKLGFTLACNDTHYIASQWDDNAIVLNLYKNDGSLVKIIKSPSDKGFERGMAMNNTHFYIATSGADCILYKYDLNGSKVSETNLYNYVNDMECTDDYLIVYQAYGRKVDSSNLPVIKIFDTNLSLINDIEIDETVQGLTVNNSGIFYSRQIGIIRVYDLAGNKVRDMTEDDVSNYYGYVMTANEDFLYVSDYINKKIYKYSADGTVLLKVLEDAPKVSDIVCDEGIVAFHGNGKLIIMDDDLNILKSFYDANDTKISNIDVSKNTLINANYYSETYRGLVRVYTLDDMVSIDSTIEIIQEVDQENFSAFTTEAYNLDGLVTVNGTELTVESIIDTIPADKVVKEIIARIDNLWVLFEDGDVYAMGRNTYGVLGFGWNDNPSHGIESYTELRKTLFTNVETLVSNGQTCIVTTKDNKTFFTGYTHYLTGISYGNDYFELLPKEIMQGHNVTKTMLPNYATNKMFFLTDNNEVYASGEEKYVCSYEYDNNDVSVYNKVFFKKLTYLDGKNIVDIVATNDGMLALSSTGKLYIGGVPWNRYKKGTIGNTPSNQWHYSMKEADIPSNKTIVKIESTYYGFLIVDSDGQMYSSYAPYVSGLGEITDQFDLVDNKYQGNNGWFAISGLNNVTDIKTAFITVVVANGDKTFLFGTMMNDVEYLSPFELVGNNITTNTKISRYAFYNFDAENRELFKMTKENYSWIKQECSPTITKFATETCDTSELAFNVSGSVEKLITTIMVME